MAPLVPPAITITDVQLNEGSSMARVVYDLDAASDCEVSLRVSLDGCVTFVEGPLITDGHIGKNIHPGTGLTIHWNYSGIANIELVTIEVIADDGSVPDIQAMVDQVDGRTLMQSLERIAIPRHHLAAPEGLAAVRDLIMNTFAQLDLQIAIHVASIPSAQGENLLGRKTGLKDPAHTYIVDGHYDAVPASPGADDNGTAVAAMLEVARVLSQYQFRHSLQFIGFCFEEEGIAGSQQYVQNGIAPGEKIHGVLNMEMIGCYSDLPNSQNTPAGFDLLFPAANAELQANEFRGDFLTVVGNTVSDPLNKTFVAAMDRYVPQLKRIALTVPGNGEMVPDLQRSDHSSFWDANIPALMLSDGSNFRNTNYHLPTDDVSTIDAEFFTNCTKAVLAAAATLAVPMNAGSDRYSLFDLVE